MLELLVRIEVVLVVVDVLQILKLLYLLLIFRLKIALGSLDTNLQLLIPFQDFLSEYLDLFGFGLFFRGIHLFAHQMLQLLEVPLLLELFLLDLLLDPLPVLGREL